MRLWHKDLISVLPRQQLLSQWRECCCIARNLAINHTPNHILVNCIKDYPYSDFVTYTHMVEKEMLRRGYSCDFSKFTKWLPDCYSTLDVFTGWHTDRYLTQCYYNLQEKYDRGGIPEDEWAKVAQMYNTRFTKKQ